MVRCFSSERVYFIEIFVDFYYEPSFPVNRNDEFRLFFDLTINGSGGDQFAIANFTKLP